MSELSLQDYWIWLNAHDWLYEYSDDHRVYRQGHSNYLKLQALCTLGEDYQNLFISFQRWGLHRGYKDVKTGEIVRYSKPIKPALIK